MGALSGPVFTIFTPFALNGGIDYQRLEEYVYFLKDHGVTKFYMMPYNGRYSQLSSSEILSLNRACIKWVKEDPCSTIIVSDPIHGSTLSKRRFAMDAAEQGADYFSSIIREKFFETEQVVEHYKLMSTAGIPIVVHAMPFLSGYDGRSMDWPDAIFTALRDVEGVEAIKEDSKDVTVCRELIDKHGDRFEILVAGRKGFVLEVLGGPRHGYLNGISMIDPRISFRFWNLVANSISEAKRFVKEVDDPFWDELVFRFGWHRVNKAALESVGLMSRRERLPMPILSDEEMNEVQVAIGEILGEFAKWLPGAEG